MGKLLSLAGSGVKRGVLFDGSHVGRSVDVAPDQNSVVLGGSQVGSPTPGMGPHSAAARSRRSDKSIPRRVEAQDG